MASFIKNLFGGDNAQHIAALLPEVEAALAAYDELLLAYLNHSKATTWKNNYANLVARINALDYNKRIWHKKEPLIDQFLQYYAHIDSARHLHNHVFVADELANKKQFFNDMYPLLTLNEKQREATIIDEDNNLIIGGAGSGKTTTLIAKVHYLISCCRVNPEQILLMPHTKQTKLDIEQHIKKNIPLEHFEVKTFSQLALEIIESNTKSKPSVCPNRVLGNIVEQTFAQLSRAPNYLKVLCNYFAYFFSEYQPEAAFQYKGDYILHLRNNYLHLKQAFQHRNFNDNEVIDNMEKLEIANFLFLHNIEYQYKYAYEHQTIMPNKQSYKPDFYLPDYGIYIEHFSIDEDENYPKWFKAIYTDDNSFTYLDSITWKQNLHKQHNSTLISTFSYQKKQGILLRSLLENLRSRGVPLDKPKPVAEVWQAISKHYNFAVTRFEDLLCLFLMMTKSNNLSLQAIKNKNEHLKGYEKIRNQNFLALFEPIYHAYEQYLTHKQEVDFYDMVAQASQYLQNGLYKHNYQYLIVDEFQDIFGVNAQFIKALKIANPHCKLIAAGDDYQAIFRFTGSDLSLMINFETHFGITERAFLPLSYRLDDKMAVFSNKFITKNPFQIGKIMEGRHRDNLQIPYRIIYTQQIAQTVAQFLAEFANDYKKNEPTNKEQNNSILIIGRTQFDNTALAQIQADTANFTCNDMAISNVNPTMRIVYKPLPMLDIQFMAAHSSKGLQADYVIILNCADGKFDFPCQINDDPVMQLLMHQAEYYPYAEERRLFYVAMTRARKQVVFISDIDYPSVFIRELEQYTHFNKDKQAFVCPRCQRGHIIKKQTKNKTFYACTLHPYCEQITEEIYYKAPTNNDK